MNDDPSIIEIKDEEVQKPGFDWKVVNWGRILAFALAILTCVIGWVLVTDGADILHRLSNHIFKLFRHPKIYPRPNKEFIQLVLIAIFVGWAVNRFRKR